MLVNSSSPFALLSLLHLSLCQRNDRLADDPPKPGNGQSAPLREEAVVNRHKRQHHPRPDDPPKPNPPGPPGR